MDRSLVSVTVNLVALWLARDISLDGIIDCVVMRLGVVVHTTDQTRSSPSCQRAMVHQRWSSGTAKSKCQKALSARAAEELTQVGFVATYALDRDLKECVASL